MIVLCDSWAVVDFVVCLCCLIVVWFDSGGFDSDVV